MLKNITSLFAGVLLVGMSTTGCIIVTDGGTDSDTDANETTGETDTDPSGGDGDGDATDSAGDGDGDATDTDPATDTDSGDGDGDASGDGDGDASGDGDGDATDTDTAPAPNQCGWDPDNGYYECGFEGEDPGGENPIGCPEGLVDGDLCEVTGLTGQGCCDAEGNNWYCGDVDGQQLVVFNGCGG